MVDDTSLYWEELASDQNVRDADSVQGGMITKSKVVHGGIDAFAEYDYGECISNRILVVSCGYGRHLIPLAKKSEVLGLDLSLAMLRRCKKNLKENGLTAELIRADLRYLPFRKGSFDALLCLYVLPYINSKWWLNIFTSFCEVLQTSGRFDFNVRMRGLIWNYHYAFGLFVAIARIIYELEHWTPFRKFWSLLGLRSMLGYYNFFTSENYITKLLGPLPVVQVLQHEAGSWTTFAFNRT